MTEEKERTNEEIASKATYSDRCYCEAAVKYENRTDKCEWCQIMEALDEKDKEIARIRDDNKKLSARYLLELVKEVRAENKRLSTLLKRRAGMLRMAREKLHGDANHLKLEIDQALQDDGNGER